MALQKSLNNTPATGAVLLYTYKELLKTATWTIPSSSDGTTYNAAGDQITTGASGAGGFANNSAWIYAKQPGSNRGLVWQRGTTNLLWRIKYSPSAGFSGGTPGATRVPSATDEVVLCGGGTDAAPTFATILPTDGTYRWNAIAYDTAPYGTLHFGFPTGGGNPNVGFALDPLTGTAAGDPDPYALYLPQNSTTAFRGAAGSQDFTTENGTHTPKGFLGALGTASNFVGILPAFPGTPAGVGATTAALPANPFTSDNEGEPFYYARRNALAAPRGRKGYSSLMRVNLTAGLTTGTTGASLAWVLVGNVWVPWDGATVPLI